MNNSAAGGFRTEARANLGLALPLIAAQLTFMGAGVLDTVMAGRLGARALAAVAVGSNVWLMAFIFFMGIFVACSPIVAQRVGAGQAPHDIGAYVRQVLVLSLPLGAIWGVTVWHLAAPVVDLLALAPDTSRVAVAYLRAEAWSAVLFTAAFALRYTAEGLGQPRPVLLAGIGALAVKGAANYALMFGGFGAPALGAVGAGWATVISAAALLLLYVVQFRWREALKELALFRAGWPRPRREVAEVLRLGLPIGTILVAEAAFFGMTGLLMARFGDAAVAGHQVAFNFAAIVFMVPLGISLATTVRVGQAAGAGRTALLRLRGTTGMRLGLAFSVLAAGTMALFPQAIVALYTEAPGVARNAETFLRLAALFQLFDCLQVTANGALRGIKDVRVPMAITVVAYWLVGMPVVYGLAFGAGLGPPALWLGINAGLAAAAAGLSWRFFALTRGAPEAAAPPGARR